MLYSTVADTLLVPSAVLLTDYSGGTVWDLHPLPTNIGLELLPEYISRLLTQA